MYERCVGGLACTAMLAGFAIAAFRDRHSIRPMVLGSRPSLTLKRSTDYMAASELVALRNLDSVTLLISFLNKPCLPKEASRLSIRLFHNSHMPLVASNTCISLVQIRLLMALAFTGVDKIWARSWPILLSKPLAGMLLKMQMSSSPFLRGRTQQLPVSPSV